MDTRARIALALLIASLAIAGSLVVVAGAAVRTRMEARLPGSWHWIAPDRFCHNQYASDTKLPDTFCTHLRANDHYHWGAERIVPLENGRAILLTRPPTVYNDSTTNNPGPQGTPITGRGVRFGAEGALVVEDGQTTTLQLSTSPSPHWEPAGTLAAARSGEYTLTSLVNGRVALIGGEDPSGSFVFAPVEVWDPATNQWSSIAPLNTGRTDHATVALDDGRIVVIGGTKVPTSAAPTRRESLGTIEIYDPATDSWTEQDAPFPPQVHPVATVTVDGRVIVLGGERDYAGSFTSYVFDAWMFDPDTSHWRRMQEAPTKTYWMMAGPLDNGDVYVLPPWGTGYYLQIEN